MPRLERPLFDVVLVEPEIPNNTGNIGRTCVATGCRLHLVHPLGFDTDEKACRRAGLDYWPRLDLTHHDSAAAWLTSLGEGSPWLFTTKGDRDVYDVEFRRGDTLVFGRETRGLDPAMLARFPGRLVRFPMLEGERSLNLATAVCAAVYEGLRQTIVRGEVRTEAGSLRL
ncbi:MAG: tRNA (cytidine(34)-2'-O)-methyltransferase [Phycisphaerae bacterium]|jgi:tRNA (cytidine/uridine-2'-O-)-methyltransferase